MTQDEVAALEALKGSYIPEEDKAEIDTYLPERNDVEIARVLSKGRKKVINKEIGIGTILMVMGLGGGMFLDKLVEISAGIEPLNRNVYWSLELIKQGRLDIGISETREQVRQLGVLNPTLVNSINALLAVAEVDNPVDYNQVSAVLNSLYGLRTKV